VYQEKFINDSIYVGAGPILSAYFEHNGKPFYAFRHVPDSSSKIVEYFDDQGNNLRRAFLRAPVNFAKISSRYNLKRRIAYYGNKVKPHRGTDYAAAVGTEILATANVNFLEVSHGAIIRSHTLEMKKQLEESDPELLQLAVVEIKNRFASISKEALLPFKISLPEGLKPTVPVLGDKLKLVELSQRNAKYYRQDKLSQMRMVDPERHSKRIIAQIQEDLRLSQPPTHIECFDNSNIQGTHPVAACVVFINAKPNKKMYRHFHIKTVEGPDDFASMEEVVYRRYKRLLEEGASLPQLIVIDGGKGQLSSALVALEQLNLRGKIAIVGIAKRLEEIYFPDDPIPLYLDKKSESLKVIQQLRNEAHRFGITFHRNLRSKDAIHSELDDIKGIGEKTSTDLLKAFKSVSEIKLASLDALIGVVGPSKAKIIYEYFH
jgi:excinuclease ABC subunit C